MGFLFPCVKCDIITAQDKAYTKLELILKEKGNY